MNRLSICISGACQSCTPTNIKAKAAKAKIQVHKVRSNSEIKIKDCARKALGQKPLSFAQKLKITNPKALKQITTGTGINSASSKTSTTANNAAQKVLIETQGSVQAPLVVAPLPLVVAPLYDAMTGAPINAEAKAQREKQQQAPTQVNSNPTENIAPHKHPTTPSIKERLKMQYSPYAVDRFETLGGSFRYLPTREQANQLRLDSLYRPTQKLAN